MFKNVFLVDITEHRGLDERVVTPVQAFASECAAELVDWFVLPRQVHPQLGTRGRVFPSNAIGLQLWPQIRQRILELHSNGYGGAVFHVLSYSPYILSEARSLNRPDMLIRTTPIPVLFTRRRGASSDVPSLSLQEGLELAMRVLRKYGHTSKQKALLQVQLRPLLVKEDERAKKNPSDRSSNRLISNLITEGVRTGCIGTYNVENIPGTERIWLVEAEASPMREFSLANSETAQAGFATEPNAPVAIARVESEVSVVLPTHALGGKSTATQPAVDAQAEDAPHVSTATEKCPARSNDLGRKRTVEIEKCLKDAGVYCPKAQRTLLFVALRSCFASSQGSKTLLQLTREVRKLAAEGTSKMRGFPFWHAATEGMVTMLLKAGVLKDDAGGPVSDGPFARGTLIAGFDEPLEDRCEAFLLETAINLLKNVTKRDRVSLAHALFWDGPGSERDEVEDRFEHVFRLLADRFAEKADGTWQVEPPQQAEKYRAAPAS